MVPRPRIELGTRGFSVRQQSLCIEILTHLAAVGQAAEQLLLSIQQYGHDGREGGNDHIAFSKLDGLLNKGR